MKVFGGLTTRKIALLVVVSVLVAAAAVLAVVAPVAGALGPHNDKLAVQVGSDGTFNIGAAPSADGTATTGSWDLSYRWPYSPGTSFTTVRVDGADHVFGSADGTWVKAPTDDNATTNSCQWQVGDILVTQTLSLVANTATGQQDIAKIAYTAANVGASAHNVGVRVMIDTEIDYNDAARFRVPGVGALTVETEYLGAAVPGATYVFSTPSDTTHIAFAENSFEGPAPDRMVFAQWGRIVGTTWDFAVDPTQDIASTDSAYALYWNEAALAPNASQTYVSSYGLGSSTSDLAPPLALGVYGPSLLNLVGGMYAPNPFTANAWVSDVGTADAANVTAKIKLPSRLILTGGSTASIPLGSLAVNEEKQATWHLMAGPGPAATVSYSVTVWADGVTPKTVSRTLALPAAPAPKVTLTLGGLGRGMVQTGKKVTAKGKVTPASYAGGSVLLTVQKKKGRMWKVAKTATVTSSTAGKYTWKYKVKKSGSYRMQAVAADGFAVSPWRTFKAQ